MIFCLFPRIKKPKWDLLLKERISPRRENSDELSSTEKIKNCKMIELPSLRVHQFSFMIVAVLDAYLVNRL